MKAKIIDGSYGEGGGQILRYAALFALVEGVETHVVRIRANRPNPGLRPQHYTLLRIMKDMFGGRIEGLRIGSKEVKMIFRGVKPVNGTYDIGTAGSISLIMQALVPALLLADSTSEVTLVGGTDVRWSPPIDYMRLAYSKLIEYVGGYLEVEVLNRGFYPKGGGKVKIIVDPERPRNIVKERRGRLERVLISNVVCRLPKHVLLRQGDAAENALKTSLPDVEIVREDIYCDRSLDPGTSITVVGCEGGICCGGDSLGEKGKPAERVGEEAVSKFMSWYSSGASFDKHLGDMAIPLAVIAGGRSSFTVEEYTKHMDSALYVSKVFYSSLEYNVTRIGRSYLLSISR